MNYYFNYFNNILILNFDIIIACTFANCKTIEDSCLDSCLDSYIIAAYFLGH